MNVSFTELVGSVFLRCAFLYVNFLAYHVPLTEAVAGMFLTMAGITLCVISSIDDKDAGKQDMTQAVH